MRNSKNQSAKNSYRLYHTCFKSENFFTAMLWFCSMTANAQDAPEYAVGLTLNTRQAGQISTFSNAEQTFLRTHGVGISLLRSSAGRWFWNSGVGISWFKLSYEGVPDIRYTELNNDIITVGIRDEATIQTYISVPLHFNYKLLHSKTYNIYIRGGGILDYLYQSKTTIDSTYDGKRVGTYNRGFIMDKFSKTIQLGAGLYLPIESHFAITLTPTYGYTFLNGREKEEQQHNGYDVLSLDFSIVYQIK